MSLLRLLGLAVLVWGVATVAQSQNAGPPPPAGLPEGSARVLLDEQAQANYAGVGRVVNNGSAYHCTGTLIAPDLVLTAAHCVANPAKGRRTPAHRMVFHPLWRDDRAGPAIRAIEVAVAEGYMETVNLRDDLALLRLKAPVPEALARPLTLLPEPLLRGRELSVYSYGYDAPFMLAEETRCRSLAAMDGAMVTSCEAVGGISGAPVTIRDDTGTLRVTAVVSSRIPRRGGVPGLGRAVVVPVDETRLQALVARLGP